MFTVKTKTVDGRKVHEIHWVSEPVPARAFAQIAAWVRNVPDYAPMIPSKLRSLTAFVRSVNKKHGSNVTVDQAISIRNIILKDKIIKNYRRMNAEIDKISAAYDAGNGILALSTAYDFPPLNLLRGILLRRGLSSGRVYDVFANKEDPKQLLSGRDLSEYYTAERNDAESTFNQQLIAELAAKNEALLVNKFRSLGIALRTQDELTEEQTAKFGRAVLTPDLLFVDEVYINGLRTYWIDYKDYIGTNVKFLHDSNVKQAAKYNAEWGPGAMCYHKSFVAGTIIPHAALLDARVVGANLRDL